MFANIITTKSNQEYSYIFNIPLSLVLSIVTILLGIYAIKSFLASRLGNELKTTPTLIIKYRASPEKQSSMQLANLTDKMAYNIILDPIFVRNFKDSSLYKVNFVLDGENYIKADQKRPLKEYKLKDGAVEEALNFADIIAKMDSRQKRKFPLTIRFNDIQGISYFTQLYFEKGHEIIVKPPKKLTRYWRLRLWFKAYRTYKRYMNNQSRRFARVHPSLEQDKALKLRKTKISF